MRCRRAIQIDGDVMLILREDDLRILQQVVEKVCAARGASGKGTHRGALSLMAMELYRKGFRKPGTLFRLLDQSPIDFKCRR